MHKKENVRTSISDEEKEDIFNLINEEGEEE